METTFCELRAKEVINVIDGRKLGHISDMVICTNTCRILGFLVPSNCKGIKFFHSSSDIFVPYNAILSIGEDVILVKMQGLGDGNSQRIGCYTCNKT